MAAKKLNIRFIAVLIILSNYYTEIFGVLHVTGSLEFKVPNYETKYRPWIKVKQDLIKRKGLVWLLVHPDWVQVFILNYDSECGLFICGRDSVVLSEIKKSIDEMSKSDETIVAQYAYPDYEIVADGVQMPFDARRYKSELIYRDSLDTAIYERRFHYIRGLDKMKRFQKMWVLSDSILYDAPRCTSIFSYIATEDVIGLESVIAEYLAECRSMGYEPILYGDSRSLPAWIRDENANYRPEMQLLYKYVKKSDSIMLNMSPPKEIYDVNFEYDHMRIENVKSISAGPTPLNKRDGISNHTSCYSMITTLILNLFPTFTSANIGIQLVYYFINAIELQWLVKNLE